MLRLTLEIVPQGLETAKRTIGVMEISNVTDDFDLADELGDYEFSYTTETARHEGSLNRWPRELGAWPLVQACLRVCHGEIPIAMQGQSEGRVIELKNWISGFEIGDGL